MRAEHCRRWVILFSYGMADDLTMPIELSVEDTFEGVRLDVFLAQTFPSYSRVHMRKVINAGAVQVNQRRAKAAHKLHRGDGVSIVLPELPKKSPQPENIPLLILYEDDHMAAINKPAGMVVHPAKGHWKGTLTSALQYHFDKLSGAGGPTRPGNVHRLDRETSGVLVVAKTDQAHFALADQFESRSTEKEYLAITVGVPDRDRDIIDQPIGVHPYQREKMAIRRDHATSRPAQTYYEVVERFASFAAVKVLPKTGRTHQIRVHLAHIGCPVLCDKLYSGRDRITRGELTRQPDDREVVLSRQALHAVRLGLSHPTTSERLRVVAPLPQELEQVLDLLRRHRRT
jgi:23S rRNA pseudouridine1911/1915/1917 synthase